MNGHSLERCWKVHGYPPGFKQNTWKRNNTRGRSGSANVAQTEDDNEGLGSNAEGMIRADLALAQYQKLMTLMKPDIMETDNAQDKDSTVSSALLAGIYCFLSHKYDGWIIDSGATEYTCNDLIMFETYTYAREECT